MMLGGTGKPVPLFFVKRIKKNYKKVLTGMPCSWYNKHEVERSTERRKAGLEP